MPTITGMLRDASIKTLRIHFCSYLKKSSKTTHTQEQAQSNRIKVLGCYLPNVPGSKHRKQETVISAMKG